MNFKAFFKLMEEREFGENANPNPQINTRPTQQTLDKIGAAVKRLPDNQNPLKAVSGENPKLTGDLISQAAKDGVTPAQVLNATRPAAAKAIQPQPGQVMTMGKK
jgi:hypothetical protein